MSSTADDLEELFAKVAIDPASMVVYGPLAGERGVRESDAGPPSLPRVDDLSNDLKVDVALVDARGCDDIRRVGALLARLRDVHAQRVVVIADRLQRGDLLALRFESTKHTFGSAEVYLSSAAVTDKRREWNNARHWANPENFKRYRW